MSTVAILTFIVTRNRRESNECFNAFVLYGYTRHWDDGIWNEACDTSNIPTMKNKFDGMRSWQEIKGFDKSDFPEAL